MSARADIFANIHRALGVSGQELPRRRTVEDRLALAPKGLVPARGRLNRQGLESLFRTEAERVGISIADATAREIPHEIADFLRRQNLPTRIRIGDDPRLTALSWETTDLDVSIGPSSGQDLVGVAHAFAGVAETGTLVMVSGKDNPTTLNFLPDTHIVVLGANEIFGDYEQVWDKLRAAYGKGTMPRTVNFITGPSRSRDLMQKLLLGVHGPRKLHIVLVASEEQGVDFSAPG